MLERFHTAGLSFGSLFKLFFLTCLFSIGIVVFILGILAGLGVSGVTVTYNGEEVHGLMAVVAGVIIGFLISFSLALINAIVVWVGQWVVTRFMKLQLWYKP